MNVLEFARLLGLGFDFGFGGSIFISQGEAIVYKTHNCKNPMGEKFITLHVFQKKK